MKNSIRFATGAALLLHGATGAAAQSAEYEYYIVGEGENRMVMNRAGGDGTAVLRGENGARPADCSEGRFYETTDGIAACGDDAVFDMAEPESSMKMESGESFATGSMILRPRESGSSKQGESEASSDPANSTAPSGGDTGTGSGTTN